MEVHVWMVKGISPLLMNNPLLLLQDPSLDLGRKKKEYKDEDEAKVRLYQNDDGTFYIPSVAFRKSMSIAASGQKFGKFSARMIITGGVFPAEERCLLLNGDGKSPAKKYDFDKRPVCVMSGTKRNLVMRVRPRFEKWSTKVAFEVDTEMVRPDQITQVLTYAGSRIGVLDGRPDPSGGKSGILSFGRFTAELEK